MNLDFALTHPHSVTLLEVREAWTKTHMAEAAIPCLARLFGKSEEEMSEILKRNLKAENIKWDTDGNDVSLPTEMVVTEYLEDLDEISDWLSEQTGYCHDGFTLTLEE